jgi:hypothetical protein
VVRGAVTEVFVSLDQWASLQYGVSAIVNALWFIAGLLVFE